MTANKRIEFFSEFYAWVMLSAGLDKIRKIYYFLKNIHIRASCRMAVNSAENTGIDKKILKRVICRGPRMINGRIAGKSAHKTVKIRLMPFLRTVFCKIMQKSGSRDIFKIFVWISVKRQIYFGKRKSGFFYGKSMLETIFVDITGKQTS